MDSLLFGQENCRWRRCKAQAATVFLCKLKYAQDMEIVKKGENGKLERCGKCGGEGR